MLIKTLSWNTVAGRATFERGLDDVFVTTQESRKADFLIAFFACSNRAVRTFFRGVIKIWFGTRRPNILAGENILSGRYFPGPEKLSCWI